MIERGLTGTKEQHRKKIDVLSSTILETSKNSRDTVRIVFRPLKRKEARYSGCGVDLSSMARASVVLETPVVGDSHVVLVAI